MKSVISGPRLRWQSLIVMLAIATALPVGSAHAQWHGRAWHGGGWGWGGGWHGGWGWHGPGWGWGGVSLGFAVPPFYFGWPYYPPAAYYPPAYYAPPYPYGYYPNTYAPSYYGYASPPIPYPAPHQPTLYPPPQAYAQPGYGMPAGLDPNNCGTPDEPRACAHR